MHGSNHFNVNFIAGLVGWPFGGLAMSDQNQTSQPDAFRQQQEHLGRLGQAGALAAPREPTNIEHATSKVQGSIDILDDAINLATAIIERLDGPSPQSEALGKIQDSECGALGYLHDRCDHASRQADNVRVLIARINDLV